MSIDAIVWPTVSGTALAVCFWGAAAVLNACFLLQDHNLRTHRFGLTYQVLPSIIGLERWKLRLLLAGHITYAIGLGMHVCGTEHTMHYLDFAVMVWWVMSGSMFWSQLYTGSQGRSNAFKTLVGLLVLPFLLSLHIL